MPSWRLENEAERSAAHKYTFYTPGPQEIAQIRPGENVKLIFHFDSDDPAAPRAERMWVVVDSIDGTGGFTGRLDNQPRWIKDLEPGDPVEFRDVHIINTEHDSPYNLVNQYLPRCYVTQRVLREGARVGYLYREEPDNERDSGWRLTAGDEPAGYMDEPGNIAFVSLGAVLNRDDSFLPLLENSAGSAFARDPQTGQFRPVPR
jgi:hypothetical protein